MLVQHLPFLAHLLPMLVAAVAVLSTEEQPELAVLAAVVTVQPRQELLAQTVLLILVAAVEPVLIQVQLTVQVAQAALAS